MATLPHEGEKPRNFPFKRLVAASLLTGAVCVWLAWTAYDASRLVERTLQRDFRFEELEGTVFHLDEVLTMSARMAAATGDSRWEKRYRQFEPQLDAAIKEAIQLSPNPILARDAAQTDEANLKLVAMENRAFALVRAGKTDQARAVLFSDEYEQQKKIYANGFKRLVASIGTQMRDALTAGRAQIRFSIFGATAVLILTLVIWLAAVRSMRHWRTALERAVHEKTRAEQEVRRANNELEMRVLARTEELASANEALRESQSLYHSLVEHLPVNVYRKDPGGRFVFVNSHFCQFKGKTPDQILGKTVFELSSNELATSFTEQDQMVMQFWRDGHWHSGNVFRHNRTEAGRRAIEHSICR
jgi:PAS domain S-box-containing protein